MIIPFTHQNNDYIQIVHVDYSDRVGETLAKFNFKSQLQKINAFKEACLWLLDHSDIKPEVIGKTDILIKDGKSYVVTIISEVEK